MDLDSFLLYFIAKGSMCAYMPMQTFFFKN